MYLEPWHADVFEFLELKKNTGKEEQRARDLFFALWIPDLFMKRVESNQVNIRGTNIYPIFELNSIYCFCKDPAKSLIDSLGKSVIGLLLL